MANLRGISARKHAKGIKKACIGAGIREPVAVGAAGFETPFSQQLRRTNRWVVLAGKIPWDEICNIYTKQVGVSRTGRAPISPRIVIGSLIIKHICNLDDRETVAQIAENMYMQYFLGYSSFNPEPPFDASLFVEFRTRIGLEQINAINEKIHALSQGIETKKTESVPEPAEAGKGTTDGDSTGQPEPTETQPLEAPSHKGRVLFDATACPQDIAYPTDLGLLAGAREKSEQLIDEIYSAALHLKKPRTYRRAARKEFLKVAQKKTRRRPLSERPWANNCAIWPGTLKASTSYWIPMANASRWTTASRSI